MLAERDWAILVKYMLNLSAISSLSSTLSTLIYTCSSSMDERVSLGLRADLIICQVLFRSLVWFENYLPSRQQQVRCNGKLSNFRFVEHGVPQGSILGPLLFLLCINDLPNATPLLHFVLFADDSNVFASHGSYETLFQMINTELPLVNDWFRANMLSLNISNTSFILFYSHKKYTPEMIFLIQIDNIPIPQTKSVKFLNVIVDQNLP